jgi:hypothetical protein
VIDSLRALRFQQVEKLVFAWYTRRGAELMDKVEHTA